MGKDGESLEREGERWGPLPTDLRALEDGELGEEEGAVKVWWKKLVHPGLPKTLIFGDFVRDHGFNFGMDHCPVDSVFDFKDM